MIHDHMGVLDVVIGEDMELDTQNPDTNPDIVTRSGGTWVDMEEIG